MGEVGGGGYWCEGMVVVCRRGCSAQGTPWRVQLNVRTII